MSTTSESQSVRQSDEESLGSLEEFICDGSDMDDMELELVESEDDCAAVSARNILEGKRTRKATVTYYEENRDRIESILLKDGEGEEGDSSYDCASDSEEEFSESD